MTMQSQRGYSVNNVPWSQPETDPEIMIFFSKTVQWHCSFYQPVCNVYGGDSGA